MLPPHRRRRLGFMLVAAALTVPAAAPAAGEIAGTPEEIGSWAAPFEEGGTAPRCRAGNDGRTVCKPSPDAAAVLPDGRILYYGAAEWTDPSTAPGDAARLLDLRGEHPAWSRPAVEGPVTLYCTDLVALPDGRLLIAGGASPSAPPGGEPAAGPAGPAPTSTVAGPAGIAESVAFDPGLGSFRPGPPLSGGRSYPGLVTLGDGRVIALGGGRRPERFDPAVGAWQELGAGNDDMPLPPEPRLHLAPNGKVLYAASGEGVPAVPTPTAATRRGVGAEDALFAFERFFDPETGRWETVRPAPYGYRDGAFSVMLPMDPPYDQVTILSAGGAVGAGGHAASALSLATTVDGHGNVSHYRTGDLTYARAFASTVVLPDGGVLALGGARHPDMPGSKALDPAVRSPELFDPARAKWREVATAARARVRHHTAVLLADGRVLFGGDTGAGSSPRTPGPGIIPPPDPSFEIYSPPYLFRGTRPSISDAPPSIGWGGRFTVSTPDAGDIASVALVRLPSPQHGIDSDVRMLRLQFSRSGSNSLDVTAPPDGTAAPPGHYYLFVLRATFRGLIPSVARTVRVGPLTEPRS